MNDRVPRILGKCSVRIIYTTANTYNSIKLHNYIYKPRCETAIAKGYVALSLLFRDSSLIPRRSPTKLNRNRNKRGCDET